MSSKNMDVVDFEALKIILASPDQIRSWSRGEVVKPETINYRTLKPEKGGLFAEEIFGPTKDWECYCGKYKRVRYRGIICDKCGVEVTQSKVRRERMGHITLSAPVAHNWFFRGAPSKVSLLLDISPRNLDAVVYFATYLVVSADQEKKDKALEHLQAEAQKRKKELAEDTDKQVKKEEQELKILAAQLKKDSGEAVALKVQETELILRQKVAALRDTLVTEEGRVEELYKTLLTMVERIEPQALLSEDEYFRLSQYKVTTFFEVGMGAEAVLKVLMNVDLGKLTAKLREEITRTVGQKHIKAVKRLRVVEGLRQAAIRPEWMVIKILPVLPPDLRPMVQLSGGRFATSDLNDLYRRVINRNNRLKRLIELGAPEIILRNEKRMLQEAVDALIDSSARTRTRASQVQGLRSLSDMLRGKQGRFRQNLLGKRVDYSGRSVIIVGPELSLNQIGLPKEMALEMFKPFVLRDIIAGGLAPNMKSAKHVLERRLPEIWDILENITKNHPVLVNRAPTLHRLGIQAFYPILIGGNAIQLHPCVCAGYNADFDGDQMAVHVPLSKSAQQEAIDLMMSTHNLLRPSDGSPITIPDKEMALGCYYMTIIEDRGTTKVFASGIEAISAHQHGRIHIREKIQVTIDGTLVETNVGRLLFNEMLLPKLRFFNEPVTGAKIRMLITKGLTLYANQEIAVMIDQIKGLGFWGATNAGLSMSVFDNKILPDKQEILAEAHKKVEIIERDFRRGLITREEKRQLSIDVWMETTDQVAVKTWEYLGRDNPVRMLVEAGARGSKEQVKQLAGMRGLVNDPTGRIVELPATSNFREGLSVFEYFTSARGSRKGLADKALKTSESGYLTRRLVDVAHDVIVRYEDCGTTEGIWMSRNDSRQFPNQDMAFINRLLGRIVAGDIVDETTKKVLITRGEEVTEDQVESIQKGKVEKAYVRSPLTCQARYGICAACYGRDLSTKLRVKIGTPVGVIAAQSIGEPGTQLTMRTFHLGGIVGLDITQGLPRVEELVEARTPKAVVPIAEIAGQVSVLETGDSIKIRVVSKNVKPVEEREYLLPSTVELAVEDGQLVPAGQPLAKGHLDVKQVLEVQGLHASQRYIIDESQRVYESQGVPINDRHFEVIVKKMSDKVRIEQPGDTVLLPGELVDKTRFTNENARVLAEGGEPATAQVVILGITKAAINTESFLSAASFQETTTVLTDAAAQGKMDPLLGLKENVIIGRLIPTSPDRAMIEGVVSSA